MPRQVSRLSIMLHPHDEADHRAASIGGIQLGPECWGSGPLAFNRHRTGTASPSGSELDPRNKKTPGFTGGFLLWLDAASIRGPFDFQSNALPTELSSRGDPDGT